MSFEQDIDRLKRIADRCDPSFRDVAGDRLARATAELVAQARAPIDRFLLAAMRYLALPQNAHTRAIPNNVIRVLPLRFVWLEDGPCIVDVADRGLVGSRLIQVNGTPVAQFHERLSPFLAGTDQRRKAIGAIMLGWPEAIALVGLTVGHEIALQIDTGNGGLQTVRYDESALVDASRYYPVHEPGIAYRLIRASGLCDREEDARSGVFCRSLQAPPVWYVRLGSLQSVEGAGPSRKLADVIGKLAASPKPAVIVDLRGNAGGNFLEALEFSKAVSATCGPTGKLLLLVDKFTFSAAIVVVALIKHHAACDCRIIGEAMGDATTFYAEGDLIRLPQSGLSVRYSTVFHDWNQGRADSRLTPPFLRRHLVAAGDLQPDLKVATTAQDLRAGRDSVVETALAYLA